MDDGEWIANNNGGNNGSSKKRKASAKQKIKCVVVGDGGTGKTSLLIVYTEGEFPEDYTPTVFENYTSEVQLKGKKYNLMLLDTAGQEDYDRLRPLSYDQVDIVIVCYDVTSPSSFENVQIRWIPETRHFCPDAPIVLVGCKTDLRNNDMCDDVTTSPKFQNGKNVTATKNITTDEGENLSKAIKASAFIECSAKQNENVHEVFTIAMQQLKQDSSEKQKRSCCSVL